MLSGRRGDARELGQTYGLFAGALVGFLVVLAVLGQYGLADPFIAFLVVAVTLVSFAVIGVLGRTLSETDFYVAGRAVPPVFNGLAMTAAFVSVTGFIGLAGAFFAGGPAALALVVGTAGGFLLLAVLVAPYFRKSGAVTVPDFLSIRFGGNVPRVVGLVALLLLSFPALAAAIAGAVFILAKFLAVRSGIAIDIAVLTILFSTLLGGMRAVTLVAGAQAIVLLVGLMAPAAILSARDYGVPIPQLTYGYALDEIAAAGGNLASLGSRILPFPDMSWFTLAAVAVSLATGIAVLPHLLMRSLSARRVSGARRSLGWALLFVGAVLITAPALAAFVKAAVYRDLVGSAVEDLPDWVFAYGRSGLVKICGVDASEPCRAEDRLCGDCRRYRPRRRQRLPSVPISSRSPSPTLPAFPSSSPPSSPPAGSPRRSVRPTPSRSPSPPRSAAISTARLVAPFAPAGRRLIVTRVILIAVVLAAAAVAEHRPDEMFALAAAAPALASGALFPALVLGIWWRRTTMIAAVAGIAAGFVVTAWHIVITWHGAGAPGPLGFGDPHRAAARRRRLRPAGRIPGHRRLEPGHAGAEPPPARYSRRHPPPEPRSRARGRRCLSRPGRTGKVATMSEARRTLFPPIEPYAVHRLKVSAIHEIHVAECGNRDGKPVLLVHGGPGGGTNPTMLRFHDPARYRIVLFDQRGTGKSTPHAELAENTTWDLVADMERIRVHLGIERWQLFGGSWGSCLALAYAETHPERVSELVLRGIFTLRRKELLWFYQEGASHFLPDAFEAFVKPIPEGERGDMIGAYHRRLTGPDADMRLAAARAWSMWEGSALSLLPDAGPRRGLRRALLRDRLRPDRMPLFRQPRLLRPGRPDHRQRPYPPADPRSHRARPLRSLHAGVDRLGSAPRLAGGRPPHRAGQRPRHDRARHHPRSRQRDGAVQGSVGRNSEAYSAYLFIEARRGSRRNTLRYSALRAVGALHPADQRVEAAHQLAW